MTHSTPPSVTVTPQSVPGSATATSSQHAENPAAMGKRILIAGGGLAGLAAGWVLAEAGFDVDIFESRQMPGGRASSYWLPGADGTKELLDNSQHILMRCCTNLLDLYARIGVEDKVEFHESFTFLEPGGRMSRLGPGGLPAPLHFAGAFLALPFLTLWDKVMIGRGILAVRRDVKKGLLLDRVSMADWLRRHGQTANAMRCFWEPVLLSAVNETLERMSAWQGIRLVALGFLNERHSHEIGVPLLPLGDLYAAERWRQQPRLRLHPGAPIVRFEAANGAIRSLRVGGEERIADAYVSALPFAKLRAVLPELETGMEQASHSPIAGIHLRFDREVTDLPHAALLHRTVQWFFRKEDGRMLSLVVSASRGLESMTKDEIVRLAREDLGEFLPAVRDARLVASWVIRETHATFVASPGLEEKRPGPRTRFRNLVLAGEWTNTGWPSTMEGAVISGYRAAEVICERFGIQARFVLPTGMPGT
jgi:squalene-associated FAD-dependent desaturase